MDKQRAFEGRRGIGTGVTDQVRGGGLDQMGNNSRKIKGFSDNFTFLQLFSPLPDDWRGQLGISGRDFTCLRLFADICTLLHNSILSASGLDTILIMQL